jgi:AcrR family transcriptional regulator
VATGSPARRHPQLSREIVVDVARRHVQRDGVHGVSLRRIAAELEVTAPALYSHVPDKRALLVAVASRELQTMLDRFEQVDADDAVERLRRLSVVYIDYALESPKLLEAMLLFPPELSIFGVTEEELSLATKAFTYGLDDVVAAQGEGRMRADLDPEMILFLLWSTTHGLTQSLLLGFVVDEATKATLIDTALDTVFAGLAARPEPC